MRNKSYVVPLAYARNLTVTRKKKLSNTKRIKADVLRMDTSVHKYVRTCIIEY